MMADWKTFDYVGWVERMRAFFQSLPARLEGVDVTFGPDGNGGIAPPLSGDALTRLECLLPCAIPPALARFLGTAASGLHALYCWEPPEEMEDHLYKVYGWYTVYGGMNDLCAVSELPEQLAFVRGCAEDPDIWLDELPEEREFWQHGLPIGAVTPDDHLALDLRGEPEDPPVVYLCHMHSTPVAAHFTDFLVQWERLAYVDPSRLERFRDPETGLWRSDTELAGRLRAFLG